MASSNQLRFDQGDDDNHNGEYPPVPVEAANDVIGSQEFDGHSRAELIALIHQLRENNVAGSINAPPSHQRDVEALRYQVEQYKSYVVELKETIETRDETIKTKDETIRKNEKVTSRLVTMRAMENETHERVQEKMSGAKKSTRRRKRKRDREADRLTAHCMGHIALAETPKSKKLCLECWKDPKKMCDGEFVCKNCYDAGIVCVRKRCQQWRETGQCSKGINCVKIHDEESYEVD